MKGVAAALVGSACGASSSDNGANNGGGGHTSSGAGSPSAGAASLAGATAGSATAGSATAGAAGPGTAGTTNTATAGTAGASSGSGGSGPAQGGTTASGGSLPNALGGSSGSELSGGSGGKASGGHGGLAGGSSAGTGGGTASLCPPRPARCPSKALKSDSTVYVSEAMPGDQFIGVTDFDGILSVLDAVGLTAFDCLETVSGQLSLNNGTTTAAKFGSAFPNLVSARDVDIDGDWGSQPIDCLFQSLARVGMVEVTDRVTGTLNLTALTSFNQIFVQGTELKRIILPNNGTFKVSQMGFRQNYSLYEIAGFQNVTLTGAPGLTSPYYSLQFQSNPGVSGCRILELADLFRAAGYVEGSIVIGTPTCP